MLNRLQGWFKDARISKLKHQLTDDEYEYLFDSVEDTFVCFDCETTGLNPRTDKVITLSAIKIVGRQIQTSESLNLVIEQHQDISSESIEVHHIRNLDVEQSQIRYQNEWKAMQAFLHFIKGATLVGYYLDFDVAMVNQVIKPKIGIGLPNPRIEVSGMYHDYELNKYRNACFEPNVDLNFDHILEKLQIPNLGQHDAFNDALMTALIFVKLKELQT